jgi:DNA repair protein RadA/Sms
MVDTVIYFEGDQNNYYRILRAVKNRFGSVNEIGILEMSSDGLKEVENPSRIFLGERGGPGSVVVTCFEGTRAILVEVEALVVTTTQGYPRRMATGVDSNRLALIAAVLEKRIGIALSNKDIYLKVTGGATLRDPATDLGIAMAVVSSYQEHPVQSGSVFIGELGLSGEIKPVPYLDIRLKEAERLGFNRAIVPQEGKIRETTGSLAVNEVLNLEGALKIW